MGAFSTTVTRTTVPTCQHAPLAPPLLMSNTRRRKVNHGEYKKNEALLLGHLLPTAAAADAAVAAAAIGCSLAVIQPFSLPGGSLFIPLHNTALHASFSISNSL